MCVDRAIVKFGLFLPQAVGQREQSLRSLATLHWCMTVHFLTARKKCNSGAIPLTAAEKSLPNVESIYGSVFHLPYTVL